MRSACNEPRRFLLLLARNVGADRLLLRFGASNVRSGMLLFGVDIYGSKNL